MKISMIVTDLDGTLLRSDKSSSDLTKRVLRYCRSSGIRLVYATARPLRQLAPVLTELPPDGFVCNNGAYCEAPGRRWTQGISHSEARRFMERLAGAFPEVHISADVDGGLYRTFIPTGPSRERGKLITPDALPCGVVFKLSLERRQFPDLTVLQPFLPPETYAEACEDRLILIMHQRATKKQGVERLRRQFHVTAHEVLAFGDDKNDIGMLTRYYGVAMGNALPEVKQAARKTAGSNDEEGLARFLLARLDVSVD